MCLHESWPSSRPAWPCQLFALLHLIFSFRIVCRYSIDSFILLGSYYLYTLLYCILFYRLSFMSACTFAYLHIRLQLGPNVLWIADLYCVSVYTRARPAWPKARPAWPSSKQGLRLAKKRTDLSARNAGEGPEPVYFVGRLYAILWSYDIQLYHNQRVVILILDCIYTQCLPQRVLGKNGFLKSSLQMQNKILLWIFKWKYQDQICTPRHLPLVIIFHILWALYIKSHLFLYKRNKLILHTRCIPSRGLTS